MARWYRIDLEWCEGSPGVVPHTSCHWYRHQVTPQAIPERIWLPYVGGPLPVMGGGSTVGC